MYRLFREAKIRCEEEKGEGNGDWHRAVQVGCVLAGSIMGFHGGAACVWNSIVRTGMEYRWMRNAQVCAEIDSLH